MVQISHLVWKKCYYQATGKVRKIHLKDITMVHYISVSCLFGHYLSSNFFNKITMFQRLALKGKREVVRAGGCRRPGPGLVVSSI
jgi:hypothetical protein